MVLCTGIVCEILSLMHYKRIITTYQKIRVSIIKLVPRAIVVSSPAFTFAFSCCIQLLYMPPHYSSNIYRQLAPLLQYVRGSSHTVVDVEGCPVFP